MLVSVITRLSGHRERVLLNFVNEIQTYQVSHITHSTGKFYLTHFVMMNITGLEIKLLHSFGILKFAELVITYDTIY